MGFSPATVGLSTTASIKTWYNTGMANRHKHLSPNQTYQPPRCWVGESSKISYATKEEAELAAQVAAYDHHTSPLSVYKCEYGDHWHLSSKA